MSNTELYYAQLTDLSVRIAAGIKNRRDPLDELTQALEQLSQTNAIKGNAADAMKAYISEVHMTLLQTLQLILFNYQAALGKYVTGYLEVDSDENFKLIEEDFDAHEHNLSSHRSDFTSIGKKLKAISDEAEDIVSLSGAGSKRLFNVTDEMNTMKKTVSDLKEKWNSYEDKEQGFGDVENLITQTTSLLKNTLSVPHGYSYSPGSFSKLMSKNFIDALQVNARYAHDNQKAFKAHWDRICKNYKVDQKRIAEAIQKEANQHKGAWEVVFGVGAVVLGVAAIVLTAGAATPLVAVAWTAGASAGAYGLSNVFEGSQIMVTGADKAFNPLRDTLFKGNQSAYDTFGNVAMFAAGSVIPVGAALKAGQPVFRAVIGGVGKTSVTTAVGVGTNFVVAPIAASLAKSAGIDPIWAKDIGIGTGFATSIFTGREAYKASGNGAEVKEISNAELNTCDSIKKIINDKGYSVDEFVKLLHPDRVLNVDEKALIDSIRDEIGVPDVGTKMTKVIPQSDIYKYLYDEEYKGVRGFTAVDEHSTNLKTLDENYEGERLDYDGTMFKVDNGVNGVSKQIGEPDRFYGTIEYKENDPSKLVIPRWEANAENYPYTATGFTGSKNIVLPELTYEKGYVRNFQNGDTLNIRDSSTGKVIQKFIYDEDSTEKWIMGGK